MIGFESDRRPTPEQVAAIRVRAARHCMCWTELPDGDLQPDIGRRLVSASTGKRYQRYLGTAFGPSGRVVSDTTPLVFVVRDGDVLVYEQAPR